MGKRRRRRRQDPERPAAPEDPFLEALDAALRAAADERFGPAPDPRRLATSVAEVSRIYNFRRDRLPTGGPRGDRSLEARLRFFVPRDVRKVLAPVRELAGAGGLPGPEARPWRVLDLGAGLGTASLAAAVVARARGARVAATALDRDRAALGLLRRVAEQTRRRDLGPETLETTTGHLDRDETLPTPPQGGWDLVIASLTLNELLLAFGFPDDDGAGGDLAGAAARGTALVADWTRDLAPTGSLVLVEPALRGTTRRLQAVRDHIARGDVPGIQVFAPCTHDAPCPMLAASERDWCHRAIPGALPPALAALAQDAGLRDRKATFAYLTLRRDGLREAAHPPVHRVVSDPRPQKGRTEIFVCGGDGLARWVRQHRDDPDADDPPFEELGRGDLVVLAPTSDAATRPATPVPGKPLPPAWRVTRTGHHGAGNVRSSHHREEET